MTGETEAAAGVEPAGRSTAVLERGDRAYPDAFEALAKPPGRIYVRGRRPPWPDAIAIVGSRAATPYGVGVARALAFDLVRAGYGIVSGLARGIDTAAHAGALAAGGVTVAVVASGLDAVDPARGGIAGAILERGAWLTEHPLGTAAHRGRFVERNRLIAALGCATVVVEAAERSGARITAAHARTLGRTVFAVPGDVDRPTSRGCHALLRQGALLCEGAGDVLAALPPLETSTPLGRLRSALGTRPRPLESIARTARLPAREALALLGRLALAGEAVAGPGQTWSRRK